MRLADQTAGPLVLLAPSLEHKRTESPPCWFYPPAPAERVLYHLPSPCLDGTVSAAIAAALQLAMESVNATSPRRFLVAGLGAIWTRAAMSPSLM